MGSGLHGTTEKRQVVKNRTVASLLAATVAAFALTGAATTGSVAATGPAASATGSTSTSAAAADDRAQGWSRTERRKRANRIALMPLVDWRRVKATYGQTGPAKGIDSTFVWEDDDCSVPQKYDNVNTDAWSAAFRTACERHDFAYRNLGNGINREGWRGALHSDNGRKLGVDRKFLADMRQICRESYDSSGACNAGATGYYAAVRSKGAEFAWHKGECHKNKLCLFGGELWHERRVMVGSNVKDLDTVELAGDADSFKNYTENIWWLYSEDNFEGKRVCLNSKSAGASLDDRNFGDKANSALRTPGKGKCT